jgi:hypothetical protein
VSTHPGSVSVDGEEADWHYEEAEKKLMVTFAESADKVVAAAYIQT